MKLNHRVSNHGDIRSKKKKARRILRPDEKQKSKETIPVSIPVFERFYASLLRSEANDYLGNSKELWRTICNRLALSLPTSPLPPSYRSQKDHFSNRAALVVEEARQALTDSVRSLKEDLKIQGNGASRKKRHVADFQPRHVRIRDKNYSSSSIELSITGVEHKQSGHSILTFSKYPSILSKDEILNLRQGTVVSCLDRRTSNAIENILLGVILPQNREEIIKTNSFVVMLFRKIKKTNEGKWKLTPLISLLSEQRKFEACMNQMTTPVPFLLPLLGRNGSARINQDKDFQDFKSNIKREHNDHETLEIIDLESTFQIPLLNEMQEEAATTFLNSKSNTINLVQGPPGTGKTTLLTSVICRYIMKSRKLDHNKRCLMVCAPTNKAITVLCSRFLKTFIDDDSYPCNVVLLGDEDKIFEKELRNRGDASSEYSKLQENFLYTFVDVIKDEYLYVRKVLDKATYGQFNKIQKIVCRLNSLLKQKVLDKDVIENADSISTLIKSFSMSREKRYPREIINKIDLIIGMIEAWDRDVIWQGAIQSADVIFCTLGSSGSSVLKKMIGKIDDLVVDEAAAATEPEIYIPFQYLPRRLLCVGDPRQLPATITSQFAEKMGLSKSLHERLMYDCNYDHIMLDTQYRMKPALSQFPSQNFYAGRLKNGRNVSCSRNIKTEFMIGASAYTLYQINGVERQNRSGSIENEAEANAVVQIVDKFRQASHGQYSSWYSSNRLRIITFYQAQVSLIRRLLHRRNLGNVLVATVDSSQGCEADFVIISFVRSSKKNGMNTVGFVADDRRLNVALTRAKYQLICVGNIESMASLPESKAGSVKRLAIDASDRQCVRSFPFEDHVSYRTTRVGNPNNTMNKKRKQETMESNLENKVPRKISPRPSIQADEGKTSVTSSSSESDCDSSTVSSTSSDSDSSASDSSQASRCNPNEHFDTSSFTNKRNSPTHFLETSSPSDCNVANVAHPKTNVEVMTAQDNLVQADTTEPAASNKTETMAVFENFSF